MECISRSGNGSGEDRTGQDSEHLYRTGDLSLHKLVNCNFLSSSWHSDLSSWGVLKLRPVIHPVEDMPSPSHLWSLQLLTKKGEGSFSCSWKTFDQAPGDCPLCTCNPAAISGGPRGRLWFKMSLGESYFLSRQEKLSDIIMYHIQPHWTAHSRCTPNILTWRAS